ncbi:hypothetical protein M514_01142 [Trichuris suis]|uniref:Uncharacterized protein n=1 Tax=Trichuris suis TaxID=68888 RepID=A0A085NN71_9BILA|nr:hypothetical protein M513_01142 [Trichuris suis]KFD70917.1 hypothetical protein M514_01142 [Trichuris suis]
MVFALQAKPLKEGKEWRESMQLDLDESRKKRQVAELGLKRALTPGICNSYQCEQSLRRRIDKIQLTPECAMTISERTFPVVKKLADPIRRWANILIARHFLQDPLKRFDGKKGATPSLHNELHFEVAHSDCLRGRTVGQMDENAALLSPFCAKTLNIRGGGKIYPIFNEHAIQFTITPSMDKVATLRRWQQWGMNKKQTEFPSRRDH